jgi:hypothetical protein
MGPDFPENGRVVLEDLPAVLDDAGKLEEGLEKVEQDFFTPQVVVGEYPIPLEIVLSVSLLRML